MAVGVYGGSTASGAHKNEDGALCWADGDAGWELAMILDGHNGTDSVRLLMATIEADQQSIATILSDPVTTAFPRLQRRALDLLMGMDTTTVRGETSCLVVVRKDSYLWWLSVGDCVLYLLHPEYARFNQYAVNQRSFFEWIGEVNTFHDAVPCYTMGTKRLRHGANVILAVTDGVLEAGDRPFAQPEHLYALSRSLPDTRSYVANILHTVQSERGTDSATVIAWNSSCAGSAPYPSNWDR